jgi:hypothetical protein
MNDNKPLMLNVILDNSRSQSPTRDSTQYNKDLSSKIFTKGEISNMMSMLDMLDAPYHGCSPNKSPSPPVQPRNFDCIQRVKVEYDFLEIEIDKLKNELNREKLTVENCKMQNQTDYQKVRHECDKLRLENDRLKNEISKDRIRNESDGHRNQILQEKNRIESEKLRTESERLKLDHSLQITTNELEKSRNELESLRNEILVQKNRDDNERAKFLL